MVSLVEYNKSVWVCPKKPSLWYSSYLRLEVLLSRPGFHHTRRIQTTMMSLGFSSRIGPEKRSLTTMKGSGGNLYQNHKPDNKIETK